MCHQAKWNETYCQQEEVLLHLSLITADDIKSDHKISRTSTTDHSHQSLWPCAVLCMLLI